MSFIIYDNQSSWQPTSVGAVSQLLCHLNMFIVESTLEISCTLVVVIRLYISLFVIFNHNSIRILWGQYTNLEVMVRDASKDHSNLMTAPTLDKVDKSSARPRGSSSPFRCISNLVHQMNVEKEHELSTARLRIEELEGLATSRQKEVYKMAQ